MVAVAFLVGLKHMCSHCASVETGNDLADPTGEVVQLVHRDPLWDAELITCANQSICGPSPASIIAITWFLALCVVTGILLLSLFSFHSATGPMST